MIQWFSVTWWAGAICGIAAILLMALMGSIIGAWRYERRLPRLPRDGGPYGKG